jgi:hypothetical protein
MGKYDFTDVVMCDDDISRTLNAGWLDTLMLSDADPIAMIKALPAHCDLLQPRGRTPHFAQPIQLDVGTASYKDAEARFEHNRNLHPNAKYIIQVAVPYCCTLPLSSYGMLPTCGC